MNQNQKPILLSEAGFGIISKNLKQPLQLILKNRICGLVLKKDRSGSTKNFHKHLLKVHKLVDPKSSKKIEKVQTYIAKWIKNAKLVPNESLRTAIVYLILDADLPFSVVERKSFQDLVWLLNEQAILGKNLPKCSIMC
ncbi:hypothetical protein VP01_4g8 [Puccinia sorghi]|uniref:Uncharacterized protein n=1 Tax=Puccinia sorghi TaxID=27349 RepID=A0A0L6UNP6_9BASI|nr:hypothetical protein VP01_4g8 [Puccinia sorghi]